MIRTRKIRKPRKVNALIILFLVFSIILSCGIYMAGLILEKYQLLILGILIAAFAWFFGYSKVENIFNNDKNKDDENNN